MLVITHNRYLLNHCFNKILHLENGDLQEFDGTYSEYQRAPSCGRKLALKLQNIEEQEEIARTQETGGYSKKAGNGKGQSGHRPVGQCETVAAGSAGGTADQGAFHRDPGAGDRVCRR